MRKPLWVPSEERIKQANITMFISFVNKKHGLEINSYDELQGPALGMKVKAYDESGNSVFDQQAELVCEAPSPSMPLYFWNDPKLKDIEIFTSVFITMFGGMAIGS